MEIVVVAGLSLATPLVAGALIAVANRSRVQAVVQEREVFPGR